MTIAAPWTPRFSSMRRHRIALVALD